jgi:uncharacterized protein (DUF2164 family)
MKRKWDMASDEIQRKCVDEVIARVEEIDSDEVGMIAAQDIIDIVTSNLAPAIYTAGLKDAQKILQQKMFDVESEIELLEATD